MEYISLVHVFQGICNLIKITECFLLREPFFLDEKFEEVPIFCAIHNHIDFIARR